MTPLNRDYGEEDYGRVQGAWGGGKTLEHEIVVLGGKPAGKRMFRKLCVNDCRRGGNSVALLLSLK